MRLLILRKFLFLTNLKVRKPVLVAAFVIFSASFRSPLQTDGFIGKVVGVSEWDRLVVFRSGLNGIYEITPSLVISEADYWF